MNPIRLVKMESPQPVRGKKSVSTRSRGRSASASKRPQKKRPTSSSTSSSKATSETPNWSKILSPKNMEDSLNTISTLRNFCKRCIRYVQQADGLLDTLYVTTNSLQESGLLKKLAETKGKNLNTADLTTMLMALMNSPLGNSFFKRFTSGADTTDNTTEVTAPNASAQPAPLPTPARQPQSAAATEQSQLSRPQYPNGMQPPPYGY